jgi:integrase
VKWKVGPKTFRRAFSERKDALHEACRIVRELDRGQQEITTIHSGDILFLNEALRKVGGRSNLLSAIELYLKNNRIGAPRKTFGDICNELETELMAREKIKDISHAYVKNAKFENVIFKKWFGDLSLQNISDEMVKEKLLSSGYSNTTRRNILRGLKTRERFARRKKYVPRDWDSPFEHIPVPKTNTEKPPVFTPDEIKRLFISLHKNQLLYVAAVVFGGARCEEAQKLHGRHYLKEEELIAIDADIAKQSARRTLDITENHQMWIDLVGEIDPNKRIITKTSAKKVYANKSRLSQVNLTWEQNALRDSFISYHLAKHRNAAMTAELAGNSVHIIKSNYKSLVTPSAAEEWFNITPISVREYAEKQRLTHLITW